MTVTADILDTVKNVLNITWQDTGTDTRLSFFITAGMCYLNDKLGEEADYSEDGLPRTLLIEYVRYARDEALDVFENNYLSYILAMQHKKAVNDYVESTEAPES